MAEAIARSLIAASGRNLTVSSAGTSARAGDEASPEALVTMASQGLDLERHRARPLSAELAGKADVIWAMTESHAQAAKGLLPGAWVERLDPERDIPDPFGQSLEVYEDTADAIREALETRLKKIK